MGNTTVSPTHEQLFGGGGGGNNRKRGRNPERIAQPQR